MHSRNHSRQPLGRREEGIALIITLMVLMLVSVLMVGFVASIIADTRASGLDRDQTQAYAASHAGLEQITSDLSNLFVTDFSPSSGQIAALRANPPVLPGYSFIAPGDTTAGSGYMVAPRFTLAGNPAPEDPVNGSMITAGPYQGFRGIITPYDITVTARACPGAPPCTPARGGAEVRMRRTLQTVAIPVFQFGMFSETDLAFHAGAEAFSFGGRVHTNGNLFLAAADGGTLTIADRITAVKDIIRTHLPNGLLTTSGYGGLVRIPTTIASLPANNVYRNLLRTEGSITGTIPPFQVPIAPDYSGWVGLSQGTYLSNIRNGDTGAKKLDLPIVADLDNNGTPDAEVIELIRRPLQNSNENTGTVSQRNVYSQRFFALASLRILLSDAAADITSLPTVLTVAPAPVPLTAGSVYAPGAGAGILAPLATSWGPLVNGNLPAGVYKSVLGTPLINGVIKIEMQRNNGTNPTNGTWQDVTAEILGLGITGKNLSDADDNPLANNWNNLPDSTAQSDNCREPSPNAVIRLQRVRDVPTFAASRCGFTGAWPNIATVSLISTDYWPNVLYDTREGQTRDGLGGTNIALGGLMHYVELDVNNLRRWLAGQIGANGLNAKNDNGFIIYFSDRRNNNDAALNETGEYGYEDVVNLTNAAGNPNEPTMDTGEDLNASGTLQTYGKTARNVPGVPVAPFNAAALPTTQIDASVLVNALSARANRPVHFRRALKLVNGGLGSLPQGLAIASENPVYVQGNFNSDGNFVTAGSVPVSVMADAVTLLSNSWNDIRSFTSPTNSLNRVATTTSYRMAIVTGKGLPFPQPAGSDASFGSDGGAHNFVRSLEDWNAGATHRYRGSMVSFFINRQAVGTFKCCQQDAYNRGPREWTFDTDFLLPSRLPPGTPMFRDVNTLTFRQLLRPTQ
jgi:hypothetical protein